MYQEVFKNLMKLIKPWMKEQGFKIKGNNFYKYHTVGNIGVINFQRNREGLPKFTINIGIWSQVLARFFEYQGIKRTATLVPADCHWETRIGSLIPKYSTYYQETDKWWHYNDTIDVEELFQEISYLILTYGIPAIDKHLCDQQLIDEWLAVAEETKKSAERKVGEFRAGTERVRMQILIKLSALLSAHGEKEKFKVMMSELHECLQRHPELTGLKEDYDKLMKESTSEKRKISVEEPSTSEAKTKRMKR